MTTFKPELHSLQRNLFLVVLFEKAAIPHYSTYFYANRAQNIHSLLPVLIIRNHSPCCKPTVKSIRTYLPPYDYEYEAFRYDFSSKINSLCID